jgi:tRNA uridine 5-carbamoylmethylation protein Kti12
MREDVFDKILEEYRKKLENLTIDNKKLIICLAGIPGSGKTYLARKLENRYKGVRINSDDIRKIIDNKITKKESEREVVLKEWLLKLLKNYPFKNKLVILDRGIERTYQDVVKISREKNWQMFIIKMIVPKNIIIKRIKIKDRERLEKRPEDIKRWFREFKEFNEKIKTDFVFRKNSDLKELFLKLDDILLKD